MKEDTKEYTLDDLEDIIREYSSQRLPKLEKNSDTIRMDKVGGDTVRLDKAGGDTVRFGKTESDTIRLGGNKSDTVRLDRVTGAAGKKPLPQDTKPLPDLDGDVKVYHSTARPIPKDTIPYSDQWEPEYDVPMGEFTPQEPIMFPPKNRPQILREKLEDGPQFLSSLKKEFSKDTKIVKEIKSFTRSIEPMKNHMGQRGVSSAL